MGISNARYQTLTILNHVILVLSNTLLFAGQYIQFITSKEALSMSWWGCQSVCPPETCLYLVLMPLLFIVGPVSCASLYV